LPKVELKLRLERIVVQQPVLMLEAMHHQP
jgi:hypothetical protein